MRLTRWFLRHRDQRRCPLNSALAAHPGDRLVTATSRKLTLEQSSVLGTTPPVPQLAKPISLKIPAGYLGCWECEYSAEADSMAGIKPSQFI